MANNIVQCSDGFIWLDITRKAKEVFLSGLFELYILYSDESENLIRSLEQLEIALQFELIIGIEVGVPPNNLIMGGSNNKNPHIKKEP